MTYFGAVRHPLTENHHVIVDILNEQLYRKLSYPLQLTYWANSEWNRSWLVKKLVRLVQNGKEPFLTSSPTELLEYWTGSALPGILASLISHWGPHEFTAKEVIMFPNPMWVYVSLNKYNFSGNCLSKLFASLIQTHTHMIYIWPNFLKKIFAQEPGACGENLHRGLAVLICLIVKLSP